MFICRLVVAFCALYLAAAAKLPALFERCHVSPSFDNKPNACLKKAITGALSVLTDNGAAELGASDLDPMKINEIVIEQGEDRPVAIKLKFKDNELIGLTNFEIHEISGKLSSPTGFHMTAHGSAPLLTLIGPYKIGGRVLILPIRGEGTSNMTLVNTKAGYELDGESEVKNGKEYLKITNLKLTLDPGLVKINFENLFGDKRLSDGMNTFLNENWKEIYGELKEPIEEAFGAIYQEYARRIFNRVPFNDIFITS